MYDDNSLTELREIFFLLYTLGEVDYIALSSLTRKNRTKNFLRFFSFRSLVRNFHEWFCLCWCSKNSIIFTYDEFCRFAQLRRENQQWKILSHNSTRSILWVNHEFLSLGLKVRERDFFLYVAFLHFFMATRFIF